MDGTRSEKGVTIIESRGRVIIGAGSAANSGTIFDARGASITIGANVGIGHNCLFITSYGSHYLGDEAMKRKRPIIVKDHAWIGYGAMIRGGVTIGKFSVVGMGAVVTRDVPDYHVAAGNPARDLGPRPDIEAVLKAEREGTIPRVQRTP